MTMKLKILCFVSFYLPGYKAGGPLRTIANMVDHLAEDIEFFIVTSDRDLGDDEPYKGIPVNQWVLVDGAQVFYCSPSKQTISCFATLINETPHDILYLNSFFDPIFTLKPLLTRYFGNISRKRPTLLAPRGEFSEGALKLKKLKKNAFILLAKLSNLHKNIRWHASSEHEANDLKKVFPQVRNNILIALDLPAKVEPELMPIKTKDSFDKHQGVLKVVFLSRISPKKNLNYALQVLSQVGCNILFHIYGPKEDVGYWEKCETLIRSLPENVKAEYCGSVVPSEVGATFSQYDLFLFPTQGENYGHVIAEALTVGTSVLLSEQTPWKNLISSGLGWDLPLNDMAGFVDVIESCALKSPNEKYAIRHEIQIKINELFQAPVVVDENRQLFIQCLPQ